MVKVKKSHVFHAHRATSPFPKHNDRSCSVFEPAQRDEVALSSSVQFFWTFALACLDGPGKRFQTIRTQIVIEASTARRAVLKGRSRLEGLVQSPQPLAVY